MWPQNKRTCIWPCFVDNRLANHSSLVYPENVQLDFISVTVCFGRLILPSSPASSCLFTVLLILSQFTWIQKNFSTFLTQSPWISIYTHVRVSTALFRCSVLLRLHWIMDNPSLRWSRSLDGLLGVAPNQLPSHACCSMVAVSCRAFHLWNGANGTLFPLHRVPSTMLWGLCPFLKLALKKCWLYKLYY